MKSQKIGHAVKKVPHGTENEIVIPELEEAAKRYNPRCRPWTPKEEAILKRYYNKVSPLDLAKTLNRSKTSILSKANLLGLRGK